MQEPSLRREALRREIGELELRIPWWERVIFFRDTPDEERLEAAKEELAAVDAEIAAIAAADEQIYAAVAVEIPQLRIAQHLGAVARTLAHHTELAIDWKYDEMAATLGDLAEAARSFYLPEVDVTRALDELAVCLERPPAGGVTSARPEPHDVWGWAPIRQDALVALANASLDRRTAEALRARLAKERADVDAIAAALDAARKERSLPARLLGDDEQTERLEAMFKNEEWEALGAAEGLRHALLQALGAYPPMRVYLAALSAMTIVSSLRLPERVITLHGDQVVRNTGQLGFAARAVIELITAAEEAFPGVVSFSGIALVDLGARAARRELSPYRAALARPEETPPPVAAPDAQSRLFAALDEHQVDDALSRGVAHARLFAATRAGDKNDESKIARWLGMGDGPEAESRDRWHRWAMSTLAQHAWLAVSRAGSRQFELAVRDALLEAHARLNAVGLVGDPSFLGSVCMLVNQPQALEAMDRLAAVVGGGLGLSGSRHQLADIAIDYVRRTAPRRPPYVWGDRPVILGWGDVVCTIGEALRQTGFVSGYDQLSAAVAEHNALVPRHVAAARDVPLLDKVNLFGESQAEQHRDQLTGRLAELRVFMRDAYRVLEQMLDAALAAYPPAQLYYGLERVRFWVANIHARRVSTGKSSHCAMVGHDHAREALATWTRSADKGFGLAPSNGILLARYAFRGVAVS